MRERDECSTSALLCLRLLMSDGGVTKNRNMIPQIAFYFED